MKKVIIVGLGLSAVVTLVVGITVWADGFEEKDRELAFNVTDDPILEGESASSFRIRGTVEYTVRDANGNVKEHGVVHNTIEPKALDVAFSRIVEGTTGSVDGYDTIAALSVDAATDDPSDGVSSGNPTKDLDGDSGDSGTHENPAVGTVTAPSDESGQGLVSVTFTAKANGVTVKQVVLTKRDPDNSAQGPAQPVAEVDILAHQDVADVTLNIDDTVQYTWTVDVN